MSDAISAWRQSADCFEQVLNQVGEGDRGNASGTGDWTVAELTDHVLFWQANVGSVLGASVAPEDGWPAIKAAVSGVLDDPSVLDGAIEGGPMNGMPKHAGIGLGTADVLLHAWDLGKAIGVEVTLPEEAAAAVHMGLSQMPEEMLRSPNMFGPEIEVAADASVQDRLLGFSGRQP